MLFFSANKIVCLYFKPYYDYRLVEGGTPGSILEGKYYSIHLLTGYEGNTHVVFLLSQGTNFCSWHCIGQ